MFIMDDGDANGDSNIMRLRTSTGHQILMDDKKGIVYVATASGNAWIEMDNTGNTNMFSAGNFSVHCEEVLMYKQVETLILKQIKMYI